MDSDPSMQSASAPGHVGTATLPGRAVGGKTAVPGRGCGKLFHDLFTVVPHAWAGEDHVRGSSMAAGVRRGRDRRGRGGLYHRAGRHRPGGRYPPGDDTGRLPRSRVPEPAGHDGPARPTRAARRRLPAPDGRRGAGYRGGLPRPGPVRAAQRQRRSRCRGRGAGHGGPGGNRRRTPAAAGRLQRRVQAVRGSGRLRAGGARDRHPAHRPGQPGHRPNRAGPDRDLGRQRARAGRGGLQRPAEPAAPRLPGPADRRGGQPGPVGRHPGRRRVRRPQRRRAGLLR